jgi:hypothetical protein
MNYLYFPICKYRNTIYPELFFDFSAFEVGCSMVDIGNYYLSCFINETAYYKYPSKQEYQDLE